MTYPDVYSVTFQANTVFLDLGGASSGQPVRLDMDEANTLIDQLIQATRCALNIGESDVLRRAPITEQLRTSHLDAAKVKLSSTVQKGLDHV